LVGGNKHFIRLRSTVRFLTPLPVGHKRTVTRRQFVRMPSQRLYHTREKRRRAGRLSKAHKADVFRVRRSAAWHAATSLGFAERKSSATGPASSDRTAPTDAPPTQFEACTRRKDGLWGLGRSSQDSCTPHTQQAAASPPPSQTSCGGPTSRIGLISACPRARDSVSDGRRTALATFPQIGLTILAPCPRWCH